MTNHAEDNFLVRWNKCLTKLINDMVKSLEAVVKWLKKSGLKVNESKAEVCLFHRSTQLNINTQINGTIIQSIASMNVLGVRFDNKLNWNDHIARATRKSKLSITLHQTY